MDDRALRDALEKAQSEVARLRAALEHPEQLHVDVRLRIERLEVSRRQQRAKLEELEAEAMGLESELAKRNSTNAALQADLDQLLESERELVDAAVKALEVDPRPPGCGTAMLALVMVVIGGALWFR